GQGGDGKTNGNYVTPIDKLVEKKVPPEDKKTEKKTEQPDAKKEVLVKVEVLGARALNDIQKSEKKFYRLDDNATKQLLDLSGLEESLLKLRMQYPKLKVELIQYQDSPAEDLPVFANLKDWLKTRELPFDVIKRGEDSPDAQKSGN